MAGKFVDSLEFVDRSWQRRTTLVSPESQWLQGFLESVFGPTRFVEVGKLGGLVNSNFRIRCDHGTFFLRVCNGNPAAAAKEFSLYNKLHRSSKVSRIIARDEYLDLPVLLMEWLPGQTLKSKLPFLDAKLAARLGREIGECLAGFVQFDFGRNGFLGSEATVESPFDMNASGFNAYMKAALENTFHMIGCAKTNRVWDFVRCHSQVMDDWPATAHLVHGDFHAENILVDDRFHLAGVVDWESAMAWQGVHDIAHLLRRPLPHRSCFEANMLGSYREHGGWIPEDWQTTLALLQLLGWIDKLANCEQRTGVIKSANAAIDLILKC